VHPCCPGTAGTGGGKSALSHFLVRVAAHNGEAFESDSAIEKAARREAELARRA